MKTKTAIAAFLFLNSMSAVAADLNLTVNKDWVFEDLDSRYRNYDKYDALVYNKVLDVISDVSSALEKSNVKLIVVYIPMRDRIYASYLPSNKKMPSFLNSFYDSSLKYLKTKGVLVVDVNTLYLNSKNRNSATPVFLRHDNHWSTIGSSEAAQATATFIQSKIPSVLNSIPELESKITWGPLINYSGSYTKILKPEEVKKLEPEKMPSVKIEKKQNNGLLEDDKAQIALIGTSFSADANFSFSDFLSAYLKRDIVNYAQSGKGYWEPLRDYIASANYLNNKPKIIVWEIPENQIPTAPGRNTYPFWNSSLEMRDFFSPLYANIGGDCANDQQGINTKIKGNIISATPIRKLSENLYLHLEFPTSLQKIPEISYFYKTGVVVKSLKDGVKSASSWLNIPLTNQKNLSEDITRIDINFGGIGEKPKGIQLCSIDSGYIKNLQDSARLAPWNRPK